MFLLQAWVEVCHSMWRIAGERAAEMLNKLFAMI